jgi:undecaprenyl-diphosphatase
MSRELFLRRPVRRVLGLDEALLRQVTRWHGPRLTPLMHLFTRLGDTESWILMGLFLAGCGPGGPALGLRLAVGALGATLPVQVLKRVLRRRRPTVGIVGFAALERDPDAFSFPSGHTASAFGVALAFVDVHSALGPWACALAAGIGLSRVYLGAHYPLDVAAGAVLGGCGALAARLCLG